MTKEEILSRHLGCSIETITDSERILMGQNIALAAMEEYAIDQMIILIERISIDPISCYSQKFPGKEKIFFLGKDYVNNLIDRLKKLKL